MPQIIIDNIKPEYVSQLTKLQKVCFPTLADHELMTEKHFLKHCEVFPEGEFVALLDTMVVGLGSGFFINFDFNHTDHTFKEMIAEGYYTNHIPDGEYYYGADISVHPDCRGMGIGRMLYNARKDLVVRTNRKGIVAGGVLPGYPTFRQSHTIHEYVGQVIAGNLHDPTLSMQLRNGFQVRGMLENYVEDSNSDNWATLIYWENEKYIAGSGGQGNNQSK
ncbi:MAG: ribosomal protein S18 acetylase RimI-like enzyme [Candidatus Promineifilaceae bacterium]|jgi:ribosomal protein S18 acetylase RimI-like enzyme